MLSTDVQVWCIEQQSCRSMSESCICKSDAESATAVRHLTHQSAAPLAGEAASPGRATHAGWPCEQRCSGPREQPGEHHRWLSPPPLKPQTEFSYLAKDLQIASPCVDPCQ